MPIATKPSAGRSADLSQFFTIHSAKVGIVIAAIAVLFAGAWFYRHARELKAARAETSFYRARQAAEQGNLPLAESNLRKVVTRYAGTPAGADAALTLARVLYEQGKYREGVDELRKLEDVPKDFESSVRFLVAAGLEQLKLFRDAAVEYGRAADVARFPADRSSYKAAAARALSAGGNAAGALAIWRELADEPGGYLAGEAHVRIGELTARPIS